MKLILRNFIIVLKRFKTSSILNILGLAIAYAVFFMIAVQVHYDLSFDRNFEKADSIFLYSRIIPDFEYIRTKTNSIEPKECAERYPEVKNFCYLMRWEGVSIKDSTGNVAYSALPVFEVSIGFIDMFKPKIIAGDAGQALTVDDKVMLTESVAKQLFGNTDPLGKTFLYWDQPVTVVAVCADFPDNCSMENGIYMRAREVHPSNFIFTSYLKLNPENREKLLKSLNEDKYIQREWNKDKNWQFELTPLRDIYFHFPLEGKQKGSLTATISLLAIGILLLIVSYINFLNFSIAMAPMRLKSFNIRRIFGESPFALKLSIVMEAVFLSFIAFLVSVLIVNFMNTEALKDFFSANLSVSQNWNLVILTGIISLTAGLLAGIYPAFYSTSFSPAMAVSGSFAVSQHSKWLKNILVTTQFVTAIFLVTVTFFISMQHDYMKNKNWNINTENMLYFNAMTARMQVDDIIRELKRNPDITDITVCSHFPGEQSLLNNQGLFGGITVDLPTWYVPLNFIDFFGINILEGRMFDENDKNKMIVNQTFLNEYNLDRNNIIGKIFDDGDDTEVIGIMEDFNFQSLHEPVKPLALMPIYWQNMGRYNNWIFIRTTGQNTLKTMDYCHDVWKKFSNNFFDIRSMDKTLDDLYRKENNLAKLVSTCGAIAIIVAIMGLYGLILFNAKSKRKMIALHKVNGASKIDVILLLNHDFLMQFVVAYIVAVPIAYYVVNRWLENFAYKTPIHWWVFVAGGLLVFLITVFTVSWQSYKAASVNPIEAIKSE
jgi:putative ABC transport system permease protein